MYKQIEDYGIIGNLGTCALVGLDGSIDWCCMPHLDSASVFCAILDHAKGGHFSIAPTGEYESSQEYIKETNILTTEFRDAGGTVRLTDFMPYAANPDEQEAPVIYRMLEGVNGELSLKIEFAPRFDYARSATSLQKNGSGLLAKGDASTLLLQGSLDLVVEGETASAICTIKAGEQLSWILSYGDTAPHDQDGQAALEATKQGWVSWANNLERGSCVFQGPWQNMVVRAALTLKLLSHKHTGSVAAAATASLPEWIGGVRNWDYRFTWIRDSSFTVQALFNLGHRAEAEAYLDWLCGVVSRHSDPSEIQIMYGLHGDADLEEIELDHLEGYKRSAPVRIGNGAAKQRQLDIYGELLNAAYQLTRYGRKIDPKLWPFLSSVADYVCTVWKEEDSGIWEVRGGDRHFVYSKVMCWVALDRAIRMSESFGFPGDVAGWKAEAEAIKEAVLSEGYNEKVGAFVQSFGSEVLDASNLLIPLMGFLPFDDPRVQSTLDATIRDLSDSEGVLTRIFHQ